MSDLRKTIDIDVKQTSLQQTQATLKGIASAAAAASQQMTLLAAKTGAVRPGGAAGGGSPGGAPLASRAAALPVLIVELSGKAHRELSGAVMAGMLAAQRVSAGGVAGLGAGGGGGGPGGGFFRLAKFGMAAAMVHHLLQSAAVAGEASTNSMLTATQRRERIIGALPGGSLFTSTAHFYRGISGINEQNRFQDRQLAVQLAAQGVQNQIAGTVQGVGWRQKEAAARAQALGGLGLVLPGMTARTTLGEQVRYGEAQQLLRHTDSIRLAGAEAVAARLRVSGLGSEQKTLEAERDRKRQERALAAKGYRDLRAKDEGRGFFSGPSTLENDINKKLNDRLRIDREIEGINQRISANLQQQVGAREAQVQAEGRLRQATLERSRTELAILKQREATAQGNARRVGAMSIGQLHYSRTALQQVLAAQKAGTLDNLPPQLIAAAQGLAPELVGNIQERLGQQRIGQLGLRQLAPDQFRDTLADIRQQVNQKQLQVRVDLQLNEKTLAQELRAQLGELVKGLKADLGKEIQDVRRAVESGQQKRGAGGG